MGRVGLELFYKNVTGGLGVPEAAGVGMRSFFQSPSAELASQFTCYKGAYRKTLRALV